jgi:hypothetical protein
MKKLLFTTGLVLSGFLMPGNTQIIGLLNENFNAGFPSGWIALDLDNCTPAPSVAQTCGNSFASHVDYDTLTGADSILVSTSWFQPSCVANNLLILPALTLENHGNQLFFQYRSKDPSYPESFQVLISTTGTNPEDFEDTVYTNTLAEPFWTDFTLLLDDYAGQTVHIAIRHNSNDKFILCLDNFRVFADLQLGTEEVLFSDLVLFPNPANDRLNLQSSERIQQVQVFDLSGQLIMDHAPTSPINPSVNVSQLRQGMYLLKVFSPSGTTTRRFLRI